MYKPMTNDLRSKIQMYIKNKLDISSLIEDINLKGEDLSFAIIKRFNRIDCDLQGVNWAHAILGNPDRLDFTVIRCNISNSNFEGTIFEKSWIRSCKALNCNFRNSDVSKVSYNHTDFGEGTTFCGAIIRIGTKEGIGCHFPSSMWKDLTEGWDTTIEVKDKK